MVLVGLVAVAVGFVLIVLAFRDLKRLPDVILDGLAELETGALLSESSDLQETMVMGWLSALMKLARKRVGPGNSLLGQRLLPRAARQSGESQGDRQSPRSQCWLP